MSAKGGLLGTLSALALTVGMGLAPADVQAQEACQFIETIDDVAVLQAIAGGDLTNPLVQAVPGAAAANLELCQQVAINRLVTLAGNVEPAAGPTPPAGPGGGPGEVYPG